MNRELSIKSPFQNLGALRYLREVAIIATAYFAYMFARKFIIADAESIAFDNAAMVVAFEAASGFFWEPLWQSWAIDNARHLVIFLNWVYIITFWPVIIITAHALYFADRAKYFRTRNLVLLTFILALLVFAVFPLAPPFFLPEHGFIDTIRQFGPSGYTWVLYTDGNEPAVFYNAFAAMPSVHFGFTVLFGIVFFRMRRKWLKVLGIIYPGFTFFAIILTGNHFIIDAVGGVAVLLAAYLTYQLLVRRRSGLRWPLGIAKSRISPSHGALSAGSPAQESPSESGAPPS